MIAQYADAGCWNKAWVQKFRFSNAEAPKPNLRSRRANGPSLLGALLIGGVVDRHRTSQQNPLIARAGELFATLTGGAFAGLGHDYDEHDQPRLVGNRNSGGTVAVSGMSDGTRDQLFLALRLAYLEDYAKHAEPVPFICDDLFVTFDDARTSNALNTLAAIGGQVQPILFTHHSHVVDIARKNLGATVNVIELS